MGLDQPQPPSVGLLSHAFCVRRPIKRHETGPREGVGSDDRRASAFKGSGYEIHGFAAGRLRSFEPARKTGASRSDARCHHSLRCRGHPPVGTWHRRRRCFSPILSAPIRGLPAGSAAFVAGADDRQRAGRRSSWRRAGRGDLFDVRANRRNTRLLREHFEQRPSSKCSPPGACHVPTARSLDSAPAG